MPLVQPQVFVPGKFPFFICKHKCKQCASCYVRERERHFIYCRCLQTVTLAIGYYNRHIHFIHSGDMITSQITSQLSPPARTHTRTRARTQDTNKLEMQRFVCKESKTRDATQGGKDRGLKMFFSGGRHHRNGIWIIIKEIH